MTDFPVEIIKVFLKDQIPIFDDQNAVNILNLVFPLWRDQRITTSISTIDRVEHFADPQRVYSYSIQGCSLPAIIHLFGNFLIGSSSRERCPCWLGCPCCRDSRQSCIRGHIRVGWQQGIRR